MTIKDEFHNDDADLAQFIEGQHELSRRLKALHQPATSAEQDAAILAIIEGELAKEATVIKAANDPIGPGGAQAVRPRFTSFWQVPVGLAAGVLIAFLVQRNAGESIAPVAQVTPPAVAGQGRKIVVEPAAPAQVEQHAAGAAPVAEVASRAKTRYEPVVIAKADIPAVVTTGIRASLQQSLSQKRNAEAHVDVITSEDVGKMPDKNVADSLQRVPGVTINSTGPYGPETALEMKRDAPNHIDVIILNDDNYVPEKRAPAPVRATAPVAIPAPAPATAEGNAAPVHPAAPVLAPQEMEKAKAWLAVIAEKLKAGLNREALEQWTKFRKAYPDYPVPEPTVDKIKALQAP